MTNTAVALASSVASSPTTQDTVLAGNGVSIGPSATSFKVASIPPAITDFTMCYDIEVSYLGQSENMRITGFGGIGNKTWTVSRNIEGLTPAITLGDGAAVFLNPNASTFNYWADWRNALLGRVSIMDSRWGTVGDGVADDTTPLVNALATGKNVFIPDDVTIGISSEVTLDSQRILANGRRGCVKALGSGFNMFKLTGTDAGLSYMQLQGAATTDGTTQFGVIGDTVSPPLSPKVDHVTFSGPDGTTGLNDGVKFDVGTTNVSVTYSHFERLIGIIDGKGYGVLLGAVDGFEVNNNTFIGSRSASQGRHAVYPSGGATNGRISGNWIYQFSSEGITLNAYSDQAVNSGIEIDHNHVIQCGGDSITGSSIGVYGWADNIRVADNIIDSSYGSGIFAGPNTTPAVIGCSSIAIDGNHITNSKYIGIYTQGAAYPTIANNVVHGASLKTNQTYADIQIGSYDSTAKLIEANVHGNQGIGVAGTSRAPFNIDTTATLPVVVKVYGNDWPSTNYQTGPIYNQDTIPVWINGRLQAAVTSVSFGTVASGAVSGFANVTIPGAEAGDVVQCSHPNLQDGTWIQADTAGAPTITYWLVNLRGSNTTPSAGTLRVDVWKRDGNGL